MPPILERSTRRKVWLWCGNGLAKPARRTGLLPWRGGYSPHATEALTPGSAPHGGSGHEGLGLVLAHRGVPRGALAPDISGPPSPRVPALARSTAPAALAPPGAGSCHRGQRGEGWPVSCRFCHLTGLPGALRLEYSRWRSSLAGSRARAPRRPVCGFHAGWTTGAAARAQTRGHCSGAAGECDSYTGPRRVGSGLAVTFLGPVHDSPAVRPSAGYLWNPVRSQSRRRWVCRRCRPRFRQSRSALADRCMARRGDSHRVVRWLWTSRRPDARLVRLALLPASALWRGVMAARESAYRRGWLQVHDLPLPSVAIGNLTVGGSGKTPIAIWTARHYVSRGLVPGILLRGYGNDEVLVHQHAVPEAQVVADPDRAAGAERALARGAQVLVLDDAYQRLDVRRDLNIAVVSAETTRAVRWPLPAGPWREGLDALDRADAVVVTRKRATPEAALTLAADLQTRIKGPIAIAHLGLQYVEGMVSGLRHPASSLAGKRVVAASGIADPDAFVAQTKATGAAVQVATWKDHHDYRDEDVAWLAHAARRADHVVITQKDAVKLRGRWPSSVPEPLVAMLDLQWEEGGESIAAALDAAVTPVDRL